MRFAGLNPLLASLLLLAACGDDDTSSFPVKEAAQAITNYKAMVYANYSDVVTAAQNLKVAIDAFLNAPSDATQEAAKKAWLAARLPYGPSEIYRFYDGPIDNSETGPEGEINSWPLDENFIDYVREDANAGLINDVAGTPQLTTGGIRAVNAAVGEAEISTGYHAIEFLLWGQDDVMPGTGPGKRPYTDYVEGEGGTASNQARRKQYLQIVTDLLVADLDSVKVQWDPKSGDNFQATFGVGSEEAQKQAISDLLVSLGSMANAELSGERMSAAYKESNQENEHSCFSDNTAVDLLGNGMGIQNVWLGTYGSSDGAGLDEVVKAVDPELANKVTTDISASIAKLRTLVEYQNAGKPIDVVINTPEGSPERMTMLDAITSLKVVGKDVEDAAKALGLSVTLETPSPEGSL